MKNILIVVFLLIRSLSHAENVCIRFLASGIDQNDTATMTENFISYLSFLLDGGVMTVQELESFDETLAVQSRWVHPFSQDEHTRMDRRIHKDNLQVYIDHSINLDMSKVTLWSKSFLAREKRAQSGRIRTREVTQSQYFPITFLPVDFSRLDQEDKGDRPRLTYSIEMMQTLVTQQMWMSTMGKNPSHFNKGGDYPVESFTLWSAMVFANKQSEKEGLKPFYDLEKVPKEFWSGEASEGRLRLDETKFQDAQSAQDLISLLTKSTAELEHAEGYRLPTEREAEIVSMRFYSQHRKDIAKLAWIEENSNMSTHEVMELPNGQSVSRNDFSDLIGNLLVMTTDICRCGDKLLGAPLVGASWSNSEDRIKVGILYNTPSNQLSQRVGLRLVRTIVKPKRGMP